MWLGPATTVCRLLKGADNTPSALAKYSQVCSVVRSVAQHTLLGGAPPRRVVPRCMLVLRARCRQGLEVDIAHVHDPSGPHTERERDREREITILWPANKSDHICQKT